MARADIEQPGGAVLIGASRGIRSRSGVLTRCCGRCRRVVLRILGCREAACVGDRGTGGDGDAGENAIAGGPDVEQRVHG